MKRLLSSLMFVLLVSAVIVVTPAGVAEASSATTTTPLRFGMGGGSSTAVAAAGVTLDYETMWVGPWTLKYGWGGPDSAMQSLRSKGVTPAIHYYYWGDDISPDCVENGCWSDLHGAWKDKAGWQTLADQLVEHLNSQMQGDEVVIFLESEFNKGGISSYEPFDGYLAEKAAYIKKGYPAANIVLPFGNWNQAAWANFDQAAAASDWVGIQGMRGSTRDSYSHYRDLFESTVSGARHVKDLFQKPTLVHDLALSSYPEPDYLEYQRAELAEFFTGMADLKAAGVEAIIYRSWYNANMDTANYYGEAERYWGFADRSSGVWKPAATVWLDGIKAERANSAEPTPPGEAPTLSASYRLGSVNEWWVESYVTSTNPIARVEAQVNGGTWTYLSPTSWGSHAKSFYVKTGSEVVFRVTDTYGQTHQSGIYDWLISSTPRDGTAEPEPEPTPEPEPIAYDATFRLGSVNEWWVETYVDAAEAPAKVEAQVNGGAWTALDKKSWGSWAKSFYVQAGSQVVFRATNAAGSTATSETYSWLQAPATNQPPTAAFDATTSGLTASFDASASIDPDGDALSYSWNLGDGMTSVSKTKTHTYAEAGTYNVTLTVSDGKASAKTSQSLTVTKPNTAPKASFTATTNDLTASFDASASSDADGDPLAHAWSFGDGTTGTGVTASHSYAAGGTYTVTLTVSDGKVSTKTSQSLTVTKPNTAPKASFTATTNDLTASFDASASSDADGDALAHAWSFGDGATGTGVTASHSYAAGGTYTVTLTVSDGKATATSTVTVTVTAPPPPDPTYDATFRLGNANEWWVEVYVDAAQAPTTVEAQVDGGTWTALDHRSWGSWAKSFYVPTGSSVTFRASNADGAVATSGTYTWLTAAEPTPEPQPDPAPEPEPEPTPFTATFSPKEQDNRWWVEVAVDANKPLASVEACVERKPCVQLSSTSWGTWAASFNTSGKTLVFKATSTSGQVVESDRYKWG